MKISEHLSKIWMSVKAEPFSEASVSALTELKNTDYAGYCSVLCSIFDIETMRSRDDEGPFTYFCSRWPFSERLLELPVQFSEDPAMLAILAAERLQLEEYYDLVASMPPREIHEDI